MSRQPRPMATRPNERWTIDFMSDALANGQKLRVLTVVDAFSRECLALDGGAQFRGADVARVLTQGPRQPTCGLRFELVAIASTSESPADSAL